MSRKQNQPAANSNKAVLTPFGVRDTSPNLESGPATTLDPGTPVSELPAVNSESGATGLAESPSSESVDTAGESREPGRPPGSKNREYASGERKPGICPNCRCTDANNESRNRIPTQHDPEFSHVDLIRCCCKKCGQWRIDRQKCNPAP